MKVIVVFDFPEISDPNSEEADYIIEELQLDLEDIIGCAYDWYLDDAVE